MRQTKRKMLGNTAIRFLEHKSQAASQVDVLG